MDMLIYFLVGLAIVVVICWAVNKLGAYLPGPLPVIIQVITVIVVCIWLLSMISGNGSFNLGHFHGPCN